MDSEWNAGLKNNNLTRKRKEYYKMSRNELVFNILKEIQKGHEPKARNYDLERQEWLDLVTFIPDNGYANIEASRGGRG